MVLALVGGSELHQAVSAGDRVLVEYFRRVVVFDDEIVAVPMDDADRRNKIAQRFWILFVSIDVQLQVVAGAEKHFAIVALRIAGVGRDHIEDPMAVPMDHQMILPVEPQMAIVAGMFVRSAHEDRRVDLLKMQPEATALVGNEIALRARPQGFPAVARLDRFPLAL